MKRPLTRASFGLDAAGRARRRRRINEAVRGAWVTEFMLLTGRLSPSWSPSNRRVLVPRVLAGRYTGRGKAISKTIAKRIQVKLRQSILGRVGQIAKGVL